MREYNRNFRMVLRQSDMDKIRRRMAEAGIRNMSAYMRKMAIDGFIVNLDLSDATFKEDAFISITSNFALIDITIPEGYTVSFDGLINKSSVRNAFEGEETKEPIIYIAAKANFSSIRIFK